jgi:hypothetical protein
LTPIRTRPRSVCLFVVAFGLSSCELAEVATPAGTDILVVEAIMRAGAARQYVLLHRSLQDRTIRGEPDATITITHDGGTVLFDEVELNECLVEGPAEWELDDLEVAASCYLSPVAAGRFVQPGRSYELSIETVDGRSLRGRTTVPGVFGFRIPDVALNPDSFSATCRLPADSFTLVWTRSEGAWAYISSLRLSGWGDDLRKQGVEVPDPLDLSGVSVSAADTSLLFPTNLGLFQRFDLDQRLLLALQAGVPAEADATLVILAADPNYTNAVRGGRFNPSGNIRISSVVGDGVGLFGSIVPLIIRSPTASPDVPVPPCPVPAVPG